MGLFRVSRDSQVWRNSSHYVNILIIWHLVMCTNPTILTAGSIILVHLRHVVLKRHNGIYAAIIMLRLIQTHQNTSLTGSKSSVITTLNSYPTHAVHLYAMIYVLTP